MTDTDDDFFEGKRPWSLIKDQVLGSYMSSYIAKVKYLQKPILLVDGYAGPGVFDGGEPGSPMIMCQAAEKNSPGNYQAFFINNNKKYHNKLESILQKAGWAGAATPILGDTTKILPMIPRVLRDHTVFLYLDPFGPTGCPFALLEPFLTQNVLHETYQKLNEKLQKQLLKNLKNAKAVDSYREKLARAVSKDATDELVRLIFEDYDDWIGLVYDATKAGLTRVLGQSGKEALTLLEIDGEFDLSHPRVLDWLNEHALEDSDSYTGTIKEDIILRVMEGVETGASNDDIAGSIKQFFTDQSDYRTMRIARTETINAYGAGALEGYKQSGVVQGKYWMPDAEVCPICVENADAGVIGLDKNFPSGNPSPTSHPHCECSLGAAVREEA